MSIDVETLQTKSVAELREYFLARKRPVPDIILEALANDSRSGVRQLAQQGMTLQAKGDELGVTRERVRQIKEKAIRRLRHASRSKNLRTYLG